MACQPAGWPGGDAMSDSYFLNNAPLIRPFPFADDYDPDRPWRLVGCLEYYSAATGGIITVPDGYRTDFASIPWFFRRAIPKDGPYTHAAIVHDYLCTERDPKINSKMAAIVFAEAMEVLQVPKWERCIMYKAVVTCGPRWP